MYKEVDIKEAVMAALEGKIVFGLNPLVPEDTYNLTKQIENLVKDGDRFIVDMPTDEQVVFEQKMDAVANKYNSMPDPKKTKSRRGGGRKKANLDMGKLLALHNAGWSNVKIAEEMGVSDTCVAKYLDQALEDEACERLRGG